jgi:hypothetical protein
MNLRRRIERLEQRYVTEPTVAVMPNGEEVTLSGRCDSLGHLLQGALSGRVPNPEQQRKLTLISKAVSFREPDGHIAELINSLLRTPTAPPERVAFQEQEER